MAIHEEVFGMHVVDASLKNAHDLDNVHSLPKQVRRVQKATRNWADSVPQTQQGFRIVDHVAWVHLEAKTQAVVLRNPAMLLPVGDQASLPLPGIHLQVARRKRKKDPIGSLVAR